MLHLRRRMRAFYLTIGADRKRGGRSMVGRITLKMFTPSKEGKVPRLRAKAAESRVLVPLLTMLCAENMQYLGPRRACLVRACTHLASVYRCQEGEGRHMRPAAVSTL